MLIEHATSTAVRPRFTRDEIAAFMSERGRFRFPSPYDTDGVRVTNESDAPGGVDYGYSYWSKINNHAGQSELLIVVGCNRNRGGQGPSLFAYDKESGLVTPRGPLFDEGDPLSWETAEGWYFSATRPTTLYLHHGPHLIRYDVVTRERETVFTAPEGTYLWQCHSSADDRVHSATLRANDSYEMLGAIVYTEDRGESARYDKRGAFDECQIDKSGRWLVIKEGDDNRIVDVQSWQDYLVADDAGAVGHSDCGFETLIGEDNREGRAGALRHWYLTGNGPMGGEVIYHMVEDVPMARHVAVAAGAVIVSCAHRDDLPRANDIVQVKPDGSLTCRVLAPTLVDLDAGGGDDYAKLPKAFVDPTGEYVGWTSNMGGDRADVLLVKITPG